MDATKDELDDGYRHAVALVDHLDRMGGASACVIPVVDRAEEYVVAVMPKAAYDAQEQMRDEIKRTWAKAQGLGQLEAYRLFERMTDRLGYGRTVNNPPLC